jgi:hexosaminidase
MAAIHSLPLIPLPNGKARVETERLALPPALRVETGGFPMEFFQVYAQRGGIAISGEGPPFLRISRNGKRPPEGYRLRIKRDGITIEAADDRGLCWALTTLAALTQNGSAPCCDVEDAPRFAYRGFMMDSARRFFPVDVVKTMIELMSMVKINVFHWHLTDDQGWRLESRRFPALHEQNPAEYYSRDEIRDMVEFARLRGMEIIPEIDLPGHATAILAAYPKLSCSEKQVKVDCAPGIRRVILCPGKEDVFELLFPLLEEIAELFPSQYIHLGGDEAPKDEWKTCGHCKRRMEREGLADYEELQGWFTAQLAEHLRGLGKKAICWNESLLSRRLPEDVKDITIQYWAEVSKVGPAHRFWRNGGSVVFSDQFYAYLDLAYGTVTLKKAYSCEPGMLGFKGKGLPALGLETCLWSEFVRTTEQLAAQAFPRAYAIAEAAWARPERKDYGGFRKRLDMWLAHYPGIGSYPPGKADPNWIARCKGRIAFLRKQSKALDKENQNNAGLGGKIHWRYLLRWLRNYFL